MKKKITIQVVPNMLVKTGRKVHSLEFKSAYTLETYLQELKIDKAQYQVIFRGKIVENWAIYPKPGSEYVVIPSVHAPILIPIGAAIAAAAAWTVANWGTALLLVLALASALYSALSSPRKPSFGAVTPKGGLDESSPTYGWDGIRTTQNVGTPVPIVYGTHRLGGNVINQYVSSEGDKNYLHVLLALCEGEVSNISEVKVNGNPVTNFSEITEETKMGTNDQTPLENFEDLHNLATIGVGLNTMSATHTAETVDSDIEAFEVHLSLPQGIFAIDPETGTINSWAVGIKIEYRPLAGSWVTLIETSISARSRSAIRKIYRAEGLSPAKYEVKVTRMTAAGDFDNTGDLSWVYLDEIKTDNLSYPNTALYAFHGLATDQLSGGTPDFNLLVRGTLVEVPAILTTIGGDPVDWEDYYYKPEDDTWRLLVGDTILYWDGTTMVKRYSANPVWCVRDLLINNRYGLGGFISAANFNEDLALEMAKYADEKVADGSGGFEKRFRLDVVLDSATKALDTITQLSSTYRGIVFFSQGTVCIRIDKPEVPVQMFTMGNIVKGSFTEQWKGIKESPNVVEVQFLDQEKDYEQEQVAYIDEQALTDGAILRKQAIRLFCTRISQVLREARHSINVSKYINRSISFRAGIDAIAIQAGDVFEFSHDLPQWGYSGRVLTGSTTTSVVLDRSVVIEAATTYKLRVRLADDTIEERTVSNTPGTYSTLGVTAAFSSAPAAYDLYSFGVENIITKPFRCMGIQRENGLEVTIHALEYIEDIYDDSGVVIPQDNYSQLTNEIPDVVDLNITENTAISQDGSVIQALDVWWQKPDDIHLALDYRWQAVKIYLSDDSQASWELVGQSSGTHFQIVGTEAGKTYYVKAVTVTASGLEDSLSGSPTATITTVGKTSKPGNVSGFAYQFLANQVKLYWDPNTEKDLAGYEIRTADVNWGSVATGEEPLFRGLQTELSFEVSSRTPGTYYVRAFNRTGVFSNASVSVTPENTAPSAITGVGADVFFNFARLYWGNSSDIDVEKYQVYLSQSDAWGGEEELLTEGQGKSVQLEGKKPYHGIITGKTSNTVFTIETLEGLADDFFNKDNLLFTTGLNGGSVFRVSDFNGTTGEITLATTPGETVEVGDKIHITDVVFVKVRAFDKFGAGTFSSSYEIEFNAFSEDMLPDNIITARKIYVAQLSALSADMGSLTAGTITGATIRTGSGSRRLEMTSSGLFGYDDGAVERLRISTDGSITATDVTLVDPTEPCNYSYLSGGSWYFHDTLGNTTPYVKRIKQGQANTGATVVFCGWCDSPEVLVTPFELTSYDSSASISCQKWKIYADTPVWFCSSATCWGYCTVVHAELLRAAGVYAENVVDLGFATSTYTNVDACGTRVRLRFQLWAHSDASAPNYCNGCLAYKVRYKCCSSGVWCECSYTYGQPAASLGALQADYDVCHDIHFGGDSGTFEIQATCTTLTWCTTALPVNSLCICCRSITACSRNVLFTSFSGQCCVGFNDSVTVTGSTPTGVECTIVCLNANGCARFMAGHTASHSCLLLYGISFGGSSAGSGFDQAATWTYNSACHLPTCLNNCSFANFCLINCVCKTHTEVCCVGACGTVSAGGCIIHCYYPTITAVTCTTTKLYSIKDCTGDLAILDPAGILNYLAIAYA